MSKLHGLKSLFAITAASLAMLASAAPAAYAGTAPTPAHVKTTLDVKSATWAELHKGDCQQDGGTIVLRSDGTGTFSATTLTYHTHTHDVWHADLDFYTTAGFHLFHAGTFDSPGMSDGNPPPHYFWSRDFLFDPAQFNGVDIFKTTQSYNC